MGLGGGNGSMTRCANCQITSTVALELDSLVATFQGFKLTLPKL